MARGKHDRREYAIKFFASRQGFNAEHALYCSGSQAQASELAQFLPKVCLSAPTCCIVAVWSRDETRSFHLLEHNTDVPPPNLLYPFLADVGPQCGGQHGEQPC
jgi:hypothetical protein